MVHRKVQQRKATVLISVHGYIGAAEIDAVILKVREDPVWKEGEVPSIFCAVKGIPHDVLVRSKR